jgi:hypothetical protein
MGPSRCPSVTRRRHRAGGPGGDLRGVPAGRDCGQEGGRYWPGPGPVAEVHRAAWGSDLGPEPGGRRLDVHVHHTRASWRMNRVHAREGAPTDENNFFVGWTVGAFRRAARCGIFTFRTAVRDLPAGAIDSAGGTRLNTASAVAGRNTRPAPALALTRSTSSDGQGCRWSKCKVRLRGRPDTDAGSRAISPVRLAYCFLGKTPSPPCQCVGRGGGSRRRSRYGLRIGSTWSSLVPRSSSLQ